MSPRLKNGWPAENGRRAVRLTSNWRGWTIFLSAVEIPASSEQYVNVVHVNEPQNRLDIFRWGTQRQLPPSLEDFFSDHGKYRFTVSILAQGVTRQAQLVVLWQEKWEK